MEKNRGQKGFSILECLLAISLLAPIMLGLLTALWFFGSNAENLQAQEELQYFSRAILTTIIGDVKQAKALAVNQDGTILSITFYDNKQVGYYCENGNIYQHGAAKVPLAEKIGVMTFELLAANWVEITIKSGENDRYQAQASCAAWPSRW